MTRLSISRKCLLPQNDWSPFGKEGTLALFKGTLSGIYTLKTKQRLFSPQQDEKNKAFYQ